MCIKKGKTGRTEETTEGHRPPPSGGNTENKGYVNKKPKTTKS